MMSELRLQHCRLDDRYDLLDCLGRGSYSEVYVARDAHVADSDPHRYVVIKALNTFLQGDTDPELERTLLENFRNEAVALDRVRHPNIISRLGHGTAIDLVGTTFHYIVLEYLPGGDLAALCRHHPLTLGQTLFYAEQACAGLSFAHSRGVIHRDIKPHNLLLTADRRTVKIADFGVAKINLAVAEGAITRVGTDIYAAPEHHPFAQTGPLVTRPLAAPSNLTPAADVYSLAKTVYMMLTGEAPRRFANRTITEFPVPVSDEPWAREVLDVLARATRISPHERTLMVDQFWHELNRARRYVRDSDITGAEPLATSGAPLAFATVPHIPSQTSPSSNPAARSAQPVPAAPPVSSRHNSAAPVREVADRRGRIVVDLGERSAQPPVGAPLYDGEAPVAPARSGAGGRALARLKLWAVAISIVLLFASMLYATYYRYVRGSSGASASGGDANLNTNADPRSLVGRDFITTTDVKLRSAPGTDSRQIGLAENGSRVRVLNVNNSWYEVRILRHGRTPDAGTPDAEQGWLNSRYLEQ